MPPLADGMPGARLCAFLAGEFSRVHETHGRQGDLKTRMLTVDAMVALASARD